MVRYLLDTNVVIDLFRGAQIIADRMDSAGERSCAISEITLIELRVGAEKSPRPDRHHQLIDAFLPKIMLLPISTCIDLFAKEKIRLQRAGTPLHDFDLLIGTLGVVERLVVVTKNTAHFARIAGIQLEDWTPSGSQVPCIKISKASKKPSSGGEVSTSLTTS
jgi:tRNA(fMet)-specific endonuclease VapC